MTSFANGAVKLPGKGTAESTAAALRLAGQPATAPGYLAPASILAALRERRRVRRMLRDIHAGKWRRVLLDLQTSQYAWPKLQSHGGQIAELLTKANLVRLAWTMHADVLVGTMPTISVPDGFEQHRRMLASLERDNMLDGLLHGTARKVNVEAEAALRVDLGDSGVTLTLDDNDQTLPVGPDGPDLQPTVWERRWVIERPNPANRAKPLRYLRVERHRAIQTESGRGTRGVVEQEAYKTDTDEVLLDLATLTRVTMESLGLDLPDLVETGATRPLITRFVQDYYDGAPQFSIQESDLDLIDTVAMAMSSLARSHALHARPKVRIDEGMVDKQTGKIDLTTDAIIDPDKRFEYIIAELKLDNMLTFMERQLSMLLIMLQISQALVGVKMGGGATPDSYDKLRLEATNTLSYARRCATYFGPALERALTTASEVESGLPLHGFAVGPVSVKMRPELPKDQIDLARELTELRQAKMIGHRSALARLHGEDQADQMMEEIEADEAREAQHQQSALFGAVMPEAEPNSNPIADAADDDSAAAAAAAAGGKAQDTAFTGIQIDKVIEIAGLVRTGGIELDTAVAILSDMFPFTEERAREIIQAEVGKGTPAPVGGVA
jgi:hypothetical protein